MDIFSHGLWGVIYAKAFNKRKTVTEPISWKWALWWGMFPDLFAFAPTFVWMIASTFTGSAGPHFGRPDPESQLQLMQTGPYVLAYNLYNISHSIVIFFTVAVLVYVFSKRIPWVLAPWLFHILCDIPTHTGEFFPTPILWPLSSWKFLHGFSWGEPWFMVLNYSALLIVYMLVRKKKNNDTA